MRLLNIFLAISLLIASIQSLKPLTATDVQSLNRLQTPVISSNKEFAVYAVKKWDSATGKSSTHLEAVELKTNKIISLTSPVLGQLDLNPVFSDDFPNTMLFLSNRSGSMQVWKLEFNTNSLIRGNITLPTQLTNYPISVSNLKFVRKTIAFTAEVYIDCNDLKCTADRDAEIAKRGSNSWAVYDSLFVRHWDIWLNDKVSHVFFQTVDSSIQLTGNVVDLMPGMKTNSPVPPDGGSEHFDIHPNGNEVVFTGHDRTHEESWSTSWKIYKSAYDGSRSLGVEHITTHIIARTQQPKYSPDGNLIAYLAMDRPGLESDKLHLEIYNLANKTPTNLTGFWDRSIKTYEWINNNQILLTATDFGVDKVYLVDISDPKSISVILEDLASTLGLLKVTNNLFILQRSSYVYPENLFSLQLTQKKLTQLTNLNPSISEFASSEPESFLFKGGYGDFVQGWILRPIDFDQNRKYPIAFLIHGGPEGAWESSWSYRWNPQLWTARGYAVVMINPHGSSGQGQKYQDAVRNDWGGVPYYDLMTGLDYAISTYSFLDGNRACALGASYGGFMVNWIQGQTDRFKCLVTHDGVFSTLTMFYATEELWFPMAEYCPFEAVGCKPWEDKYRDRYLKYSPETYVANWKTPHLVIHGSNDFRIPITEGISAFTALQLKGIPSRFLHFTQENHWVLKPENSIKWYEEVLNWIDKYTKTTLNQETLKFLEDTQ